MLDISVIIIARNMHEKEEEMPQIFKALATIMAWVLWICALVCGFSYLIMGIIIGDLYNSSYTPPMEYAAGFAVAGFFAMMAVVIMLLRKKME
jgi:hypothetical protein